MTVYVDNAFLKFRNMLMCHLVADSTEELLDMARKIGVKVKWIQHAGQPGREHFDICQTKRNLALKAGAVPVSWPELAVMLRTRKNGILVTPAKSKDLLMR
jgi:hypothetical protein